MGTVAKALSLLGYFSRDRPLIGLSELARLSDLNKATVYRLLSELQSEGFVEQAGSGREYRLGAAYLRLASLREAVVPTREVARKVLQSLSDATGETAHFSLVQGQSLSVVAYVYSPQHGTRVTMEDADEIPLHATSSGFAVLAYSPADWVDCVLANPLERRTDQTITDPEKIRGRFDDVRRCGVAESVSGFEKDVHSHASPIFGPQENCIGALAVATPVSRMTPEAQRLICQHVATHALDLTRLLGGFAPDDFKRSIRI